MRVSSRMLTALVSLASADPIAFECAVFPLAPLTPAVTAILDGVSSTPRTLPAGWMPVGGSAEVSTMVEIRRKGEDDSRPKVLAFVIACRPIVAP